MNRLGQPRASSSPRPDLLAADTPCRRRSRQYPQRHRAVRQPHRLGQTAGIAARSAAHASVSQWHLAAQLRDEGPGEGGPPWPAPASPSTSTRSPPTGARSTPSPRRRSRPPPWSRPTPTASASARRPGARPRRRPSFFVAPRRGGRGLRERLGPGPAIHVFAGLMPGDDELVRAYDLVPCLNSPAQMRRLRTRMLPGRPCALQLDSGMNRLGLEPAELDAAADLLPRLAPAPRHQPPRLRRRARPPDERRAARRLRRRRRRAPGGRRSLAATGGILLGPDFHYDLTRPGIGLYGGLPFADARPVVALALPVVQVRDVAAGEAVGYGAAWTAARPARIATVAAGYADGLPRALGGRGLALYAGGAACPVVGRVSMDLITVDVTDLPEVPDDARHPQRPPDRRHARRRRRHHRLRDPDQPWRPLRSRLLGSACRRTTAMTLVRLLHAFLASIGRSTLGLLAATGRHRDLRRGRGLAPRPAAVLRRRARPPADPHRLFLAAGGRADHALHRRRARPANLRRRRPVQRRDGGALDRRHRHRARARAGARRPDGRRPRLLLDRGRARHHAGDRADRRADHALDRPDEVPRAAARAGRDAGAAGPRRDRRRRSG